MRIRLPLAMSIMIMILSNCLAMQSHAAEPAAVTERFVFAGRAVAVDGTNRQQYAHINTARGTWDVLLSLDITYESAMFLRGHYLTARGDRVTLGRDATVGTPDRPAFRLRTTAPDRGAPWMDQLTVRQPALGCISPDGSAIVLFEASSEPMLVIAGPGGIHRVPVPWFSVQSFSWNPQGTQVAFYYARTADDDYPNVQHHGLAVLDVNGTLRELVTPERSVPTPRSNAKYVPPGWNPGGHELYYSDGLRPSPTSAATTQPAVFPLCVTRRIDVDSGAAEQWATGDFAAISPHGDYILVYPSPLNPAAGDRSRACTTKVLIPSRAMEPLPMHIRYPILSPSGASAACFNGQEITVVNTSDWQRQGKAITLSRPLSVDKWYADFKWIIHDAGQATTQGSTSP